MVDRQHGSLPEEKMECRPGCSASLILNRITEVRYTGFTKNYGWSG